MTNYPKELIEDFEKKFPPSANIRRKGGNSGYVSAGSSDYMQEAREWTLIYKGFAANWERVRELEQAVAEHKLAFFEEGDYTEKDRALWKLLEKGNE